MSDKGMEGHVLVRQVDVLCGSTLSWEEDESASDKATVRIWSFSLKSDHLQVTREYVSAITYKPIARARGRLCVKTA